MSELLKEFPGCLPSQLLAEDAETVLNIVKVRRYVHAFVRVMSPETTEDDLYPGDQDLVWPNVERLINEQ